MNLLLITTLFVGYGAQGPTIALAQSARLDPGANPRLAAERPAAARGSDAAAEEGSPMAGAAAAARVHEPSLWRGHLGAPGGSTYAKIFGPGGWYADPLLWGSGDDLGCMGAPAASGRQIFLPVPWFGLRGCRRRRVRQCRRHGRSTRCPARSAPRRWPCGTSRTTTRCIIQGRRREAP